MQSTMKWAGAAAALVTLLGTAPAARAADAVYGGSSSRGEAIVINADKAAKKLRSAVIGWRAQCAGGMYYSDGATLTPATSSAGFTPRPRDLQTARNGKRRFAGIETYGADLGDTIAAVMVKLDGRLSAKSASGTLSADVSLIERATGNEVEKCSTGRLRWRATRAPGRVFGGRTSQDQPLVVRLDAKRKRVTDLLVSWDSSSCQPEGFAHFPESLSNFPVSRTGTFKDSWDDSESLSDGGSARTTYSLSGRIARRAARGRLQIGVAWLDAAGATTMACDSGGVTWKALTG